MDIRPINMQAVLHRAAEMNRATNNDGSRAAVQQGQFADEFEKLRERERAQVVEAQETAEGQNVNPDGSAGKEKQQQNKKKRPDGTDGNENKPAPQKLGRGMIDIRM